MLMKSFARNKTLLNSVRFFTTADAKKTTLKEQTSLSFRFHQLYVQELERLKSNSTHLVAAKYKVAEDKTPTEAYVHPYHSTKFPVYWSSGNLANFLTEAMGPEPVSPHYESFLRSRRYIVVTALAIMALRVVDKLNLTSFYGQHAVYEVYTIFGVAIGVLESRYILQKLPAPRLTWFYDAFVNHEYKQMMLNWQDTVEEMTRKFLANSKEQLDYYLLHKEYSFIKKRALSAFLENEKKNLEKHFYDRTADMLKNIENMENNNVKNTIRRVTEESLQTVLRRLNNPEERKNLHKSTFNSALQGLRMGKMTYEGDVVLPMLLDEIKSRLDPLTKLTKEEESSMFQLTPEQKRSLIDSDNRAKIQYLAQAPDVASAAVKNADAYKNIVSRMKRRVESTFKL